MEIVLLLLCIPLYVLNSFCDKYVSTKNNSIINIVYNIVKFGLGSVIFFGLFLGSPSKLEWGSFVCGVISGLMFTISKIIILYGYEKTTVAFMTLCHASGMLLPCIIGHFLWDEKLVFLSFAGIILVILSIFLLKDNAKVQKKQSALGIVLGIIVLVASGAIMIIQKIMGIYFSNQGVDAYNFYSFFSAFLFLLMVSKGKLKKENCSKRMLLCGLGSAVALCIINIMMTNLAASVPSVIMFPLFNGCGVISVALLSWLLFNEKLTFKNISGMIIGLIGLFLLSYK